MGRCLLWQNLYMFQGLEGELLGPDSTAFWMAVAIQIWELPWKGVALWRSARNKHFGWFVALLLIHLAGLIDIIYIFYFSEPKKKPILRVRKPIKKDKK